MAEINKRQGGEVERTGGKEEVKKTRHNTDLHIKYLQGHLRFTPFYLLLKVKITGRSSV